MFAPFVYGERTNKNSPHSIALHNIAEPFQTCVASSYVVKSPNSISDLGVEIARQSCQFETKSGPGAKEVSAPFEAAMKILRKEKRG